MAAALKGNQSYPTRTNKQFREQKKGKNGSGRQFRGDEKSFAQTESAAKIHNCCKKYWILPTLWEELTIVPKALNLDWV